MDFGTIEVIAVYWNTTHLVNDCWGSLANVMWMGFVFLLCSSVLIFLCLAPRRSLLFQTTFANFMKLGPLSCVVKPLLWLWFRYHFHSWQFSILGNPGTFSCDIYYDFEFIFNSGPFQFGISNFFVKRLPFLNPFPHLSASDASHKFSKSIFLLCVTLFVLIFARTNFRALRLREN